MPTTAISTDDGLHVQNSVVHNYVAPEITTPAENSAVHTADEDSSDEEHEADVKFTPDSVYPKEYLKTIFAFVILILGFLANGLVITYLHQLTNSNTTALQDIVFRLIPYHEYGRSLADIMLPVCAGFSILVIVFHKHASVVLRRMMLLASVLQLMRAMFLMCTYLPPPFPDASERCLPRLNASTDPWDFARRAVTFLALTVGFMGDGSPILCGDTIYSGHTATYVLAHLIVWQYCPRPWRPVIPVLSLLAVTNGITSLLISRQHYTIDVVVAFFVTVTTFHGYHNMCKRRRHKSVISGNIFMSLYAVFSNNCCRICRRSQVDAPKFRFRPLYAVFLFFEKNVPRGKVPKDLAWPLPWPKKVVRLFERWNGNEFFDSSTEANSHEGRCLTKKLKKKWRCCRGASKSTADPESRP